MHPGELGGHADDVDGALAGALRLGLFGRPVRFDVHRVFLSHDTPSVRRGDSFEVSLNSSSSFFCSRDSFSGTSTRTVANRSPWPPRFGAPLPLIRNVLPVWVPAGTFNVTGPFSVGTLIWAPSAASG